MSYYNSENTMVLATHEQAGGNTRMLLLHETNSPKRPHEYVIGSYFTRTPYAKVTFGDVPTAENLEEYSWDWGHYFGSVFDAVDYWKREVLGVEPGGES